MLTEGLYFYHGTTSSSARHIIAGGARDLNAALNMQVAARLIVERIEKAPGGYVQAFQDAGSKIPTTAPIALRNLAEGYSESLFAYGPFFATLDPRSAYKYALRGGAEALQCLREGIAVTEWLGDPVHSELRSVCSDLLQAIDALSVSHPVIIGLRGIPASRIARESGAAVTVDWLKFMADLVAQPGYSVPATVRISDVAPSDVVAVHDLAGHKAIDDPMPYFDEGWSLPRSVAPSLWLGSLGNSLK
ncbi:hypothetical protein A0J48_026290 [Sphaerospermopsis aphanizomenoides BCCUSP55]|uniref:hypothetical protein n=1 Tax=Sphaerospermopsis aphanizomenoides TaxID=459663 RepID=UPI0019059266|nr:hypothetical protein [Sphaerospermopsis aphanizomenoides]MBK1990976.1 hypothetical protein [Sphaerospermopsis aphanizomenoides BCCUSP55]